MIDSFILGRVQLFSPRKARNFADEGKSVTQHLRVFAAESTYELYWPQILSVTSGRALTA